MGHGYSLRLLHTYTNDHGALFDPVNAMAGGNRIRERGRVETRGVGSALQTHAMQKRIWIGCLGGDLDSHPKIWSLGAEEEFWEDTRKQSWGEY